MSKKHRVLLIEDSLPQAKLFIQYMKSSNIEMSHASTGKQAKELIRQLMPELILLDLNLPDMDGQDILLWVKEQGLPSATIVITGHGSIDVAVAVMRLGADDFLEKPVSADRLRTSIDNLLEKRRLQNMLNEYHNIFERKDYHGFIGSSLPMQAIYRIIDAAASSKATVFITGESGTGKEVCAEAIHKQGSRTNKPFVAINCGAIPRDLMESEIFGHIKGAFTGAVAERKGAASQADGGTLFLDEIGEMDMDLQTKLLRFVQTGSFQKVGSSQIEEVDIRFICATNRDPLEAVAAGQLREDLYYRLHVVPIQLPPLRERGEDILAIASNFLNKYADEEGKRFRSFQPEVEVILNHYSWPGNVRQLQNVIRNILVLHDDDSVQQCHLPPPLDTAFNDAPAPSNLLGLVNQDSRQKEVPSSQQPIIPLLTVERETIERAINVCEGNIPKAAALLEVSPSTIYRKKQSWESA